VPPTPADAIAWKKAGVEAREPAAAARAAVTALRARGAELVIALLHLPTEADSRKLLGAVPGIDWAVLGHVGSRFETAQPVGDAGTTRLLAAMSEGKELGRADLHVVGQAAAKDLSFVDRGARAELAAILADHRRQLAEYDHPLGNVDPQSLRDYHDARKRQIGDAIAREQTALAKLPAAIGGSWFENRLIPLDATTPDQPGVAVLVDAYNQESAHRASAGRPAGFTGDEPPAPPSPPDPAKGYTGTAACGACHAPALAFWQATKHARALAALTRIGRDRDVSCVGCHVTGYRQPGGPTALAVARDRFANVGCEACHGPGRAHADAKAQPSSLPASQPASGPAQGALGPVAEATCRGCHTVDRTNGEFDYARSAAGILGPGHGKPALAPGAKAPL
jgi:hypothetical protein